jgi:CBS domain-containing protein
VLKALNAGGAAWSGATVADAMLRNPRTAGLGMDLDELRRLMIDDHQRYLPVMDGATLMGVVSFHDVAKAVLEEQSFENKMLKNYIRNWPGEAGED